MTTVGTSVLALFCFSGLRAARRVRASLAGATAAALLSVLSVSTAFAQTTTVTAAWDRNTDTATAGYLVYYGTAPGNYQWSYDAGNQVSAALTLTRGAGYYVAVRAYNTSAQVGPPSNEATINLATAAPTAQITATMQNATTALVSWQTTNAVSATINGTAVALSGSTSVTVATTTTFTLVATSSSGATASRSATATVTPAPTPAPTATITATMQNATTALVTWQTTNAVSATLNGSAVALSGSMPVTIATTTTFTLVATSSSGATASRSATATVTPAPTPAPTAAITATMQNATTALVTWQTTNAVSAALNGAAVALSGSTLVTLSATTTFTLVATGASGATATQSATATVTPPSSSTPSAATNMAAIVSGARATLSWRAPTTGAAPDRYLLYVGSSSGGTNLANAFVVGNVLTVAGDLPRGRYYARVRAANNSGASAESNEMFFKIGRNLVSPRGFTVRWVGTTAVLSWTAPAADGAMEDRPTSYVLEAGTRPGASDVATVSVGSATRFEANVPSGTHYVRVRAVNDYGDSEPTEDLMLVAPGAPRAPTNLASPGSGSTVNLQWTAPSGAAVTGYLIEAGSAPERSDLGVLQVGNVTSFTAPAPPQGAYYVRVRAINARGAGQPSNEVIVRR